MNAIKTIGIMTGNSLDAVDVVLTEFAPGAISDIAAYSLDYPLVLRKNFLELRARLQSHKNSMSEIFASEFFVETINTYTQLVAQAVNALLKQGQFEPQHISALGFHGQTCDHFPPSIAGDKPPYTLQVGNPNLLADLTGIPVIYDFRSDDLMNGGEGAPLAPLHHQHLSNKLRQSRIFPLAFCNAGNTGNISVISKDNHGKEAVLGWDVGPFNHLCDKLAQQYYNEPYDKNAVHGSQGQIKMDLLQKLFHEVATNSTGNNFYLEAIPKSSDPSWYHLPDISAFRPEDALRTAGYLSVYGFFHSLQYIPPEIVFPKYFLAFGGGWKNPLMMNDFNLLLAGQAPVLAEHKELFVAILNRLPKDCRICWSDDFGYSAQYMEARIFADLAYCKMNNIPFTTPEITGCKVPTVCGIWCHPHSPQQPLYNRASRGWQQKLND